ncbi:YhdP family protein [Thiohalorhabdus methylotrophus]|uniref:YhdP family protein n=1 Tax=Thiohalorhabdus methylotrophus TaxID=3242694 RepID=A0ABV4TPQ7_9GAMM
MSESPPTPPLPWYLRRSFWRWVVRGLVALLLLLAALVTWVLLYPPSLAPIRADLEDLLSRKLDRRIAFQDLDWTWSGGLKVRVSGVEVGSRNLGVDQVRLGVELLSLLRGEARLQELELVGLDLRVERRADGRLVAGGFRMKPGRNLVYPLLARFDHFRIADSTLHWTDHTPAETVRVALREWRVDIRRDGDAHRVDLHGALGAGEVGVRGRIRHFDGGPPEWELDVQLLGSTLSLDALRPYLEEGAPRRIRGKLAFWAEARGGMTRGITLEGRIHLAEAGVHWPARLRKPLTDMELGASFRYRWDRPGQELALESLELRSGALHLKGRTTLRLPPGSGPRLDLALRAEPVTFAELQPLHRFRAFPERASAWLGHALAGRITETEISLRGPLRRFPFPEDAGRFRVRAEMEGVRLAYEPGWPPVEDLAGTLTLDGTRLGLSARSGRILQAEVRGLEASIHDWTARPPRLRLQGNLDLKLVDGIRFLERSGLAEKGFLDPAILVGGGKLDLGLELPLGKQAPPEVYGRLRMEGAAYRPAPGMPALVGLNGAVDFQGPHITATGLRARLFGEPVRLALEREPEAPLRLQLEGDFPANVLRRAAARLEQEHPLLRRVTGTLQTRVSLVAGEDTRRFRARMDLGQAALALPEPLFNAIGQPGMLAVEGRLLGRPEYRARLVTGGDEWRGRLEETPAGVLEAGLGVGFGQPAPTPELGLCRMTGELDALALGRWTELVRSLRGGPESRTQSRMPRLEMDLLVGQVRWGRKNLYAGRVALDGRPVPGGYRWRGGLEGNRAAGRFRWMQRTGRDRVEVRIGRLRLPGPGDWGSTGSGSGSGSHDLPPLDLMVTADRIRLGEQMLEDSHLEARLFEDHWVIPVLESSIGATTVRVEGGWSAEKGRTHARMELRSRDFGRLLRDAGVYPSMKGGKGTARGRVSWPGRPANFAGGRLDGSVRLDMREGEIEEFHFLSKALSTLNILDWPKQAIRGFSDLGSNGLVYRRMQGKGTIEDGTLTLKRMALESAALRLTADGGLDLGARTYDLTMHLHPLQTLDKLVSAVPLLGYLLTGKDKAFASLDYRVRGPWEEPRVTAVNPSDQPDFMEVLVERLKKMQWKDLAPWR